MAPARPGRPAAHRARHGAHAGLRPPGHEGHGEGPRAARRRRAGLRHGARQHVPPVHRARPRAHRALRWPPAVHGLGRAGDHRLGRLPGLLDASGCDGIAIGGSLGADKDQIYEVVGWTTAVLDERPASRPRHLLGIGDVDDLIRGVELGIDTFDCAMSTRLGRHGMALVPEPDRRWRVDLTAARWADSDEPIMEGCPCPACRPGIRAATCATWSSSASSPACGCSPCTTSPSWPGSWRTCAAPSGPAPWPSGPARCARGRRR
jgi:hypothetical protein